MAVTHTFETARLLAQCPSEADAPAVHAAIVESHAELQRWLEWAQIIPASHETERLVAESQAAFRAGERFGFNLFLQEAGDFVCKLELRPAPPWIQDVVAPGDWWEFGYWCRTKYLGQGYMSEALAGAMRWALSQLGLAWFIIRVDAENIRSQKLATRLGFKMNHTHPATFLGEPRVEWVYEKRVLP